MRVANGQGSYYDQMTFKKRYQLEPLFDKQGEHVGWWESSNGIQNIFNLQLEWIAYESSQDMFAPKTNIWLGAFIDGCLVDRVGNPVAFLPNAIPDQKMPPQIRRNRPPTSQPMRPKEPMKPQAIRPPQVPRGGWSELDFLQWASQL